MHSPLLPLLSRGPLVLAAGAHDSLSAKLAEEAGFDAIWASGFGISAVQAVPDANILTLTETLEAVRHIVDAVHIPVVADCDNGYGNAINVMRTVGEFERAGAAGVCIEDNDFPKRCSFYAGVRRELVPVDEHARKIEAATAARRDPAFAVIARTEALIAGLGVDEALGRARAYAAAGADAVLVHSKARDFRELASFAAACDPGRRLRGAADAAHPGPAEDHARGEGAHHPRPPGDGPPRMRRAGHHGGSRLPEGSGRGGKRAVRRQRPLPGDGRALFTAARQGGARRAVPLPLRRHHLRAGDPGAPSRQPG